MRRLPGQRALTEASAEELRVAVVGVYLNISVVSVPTPTTKLAGRVKEVRESKW